MSGQTISFIRELSLDDAPAEVVDQSKRCLLDLIGVAAAGSRLEASRIIRAVAERQFGGTGGSFLFDGRSVSGAGAALANATTIDGFDAHDGHPLTKGHAGCGSLAGLLAFVGDGRSTTGREALAHLIVGYEVAIRAGVALHATAAEYHTSGAWVSLGVAAIGARLLGLDPAATREALGIAEYNGPRSQMMRCIDHPAMIKDGSGWGAMTGVVAACLAREGFTGAPAITVEDQSVTALWRTSAGAGASSSNISRPIRCAAGRSRRWKQRRNSGATTILAPPRSKPSRSGHSTKRAGSRPLDRAAPTRRNTACRFRLPHCLPEARSVLAKSTAMHWSTRRYCVCRGRTELIDDPRYSALFPRERWAEVEIALADGRRLASRPSVARGSAENPLSDHEISEKFHELMDASGVGDRARRIEDMVMTIDVAPSIAPLLEALTQPAEASVRLERVAR